MKTYFFHFHAKDGRVIFREDRFTSDCSARDHALDYCERHGYTAVNVSRCDIVKVGDYKPEAVK